MTAAREYDSVRTTTDIVSDDGRTIPAGIRGAVLDAKPDGTCLAEFAFAPQQRGLTLGLGGREPAATTSDGSPALRG